MAPIAAGAEVIKVWERWGELPKMMRVTLEPLGTATEMPPEKAREVTVSRAKIVVVIAPRLSGPPDDA